MTGEERDTIDDVLAHIAAELGRVGVGKTGTASSQMGGWKYRQIVDVLNAVGPAMAAYGVYTTVEFKDRTAERIPTKTGGTMVSVVLTGVFTYHWKKESRTTITIGEAVDTGALATNKAMSAATKYAHGLTFSIPFAGMIDSESDNGEKVLNAAEPREQLATRMPVSEVDYWKAKLAEAKTRDKLQEVYSGAVEKTNFYGDKSAYEIIKQAALDAKKVLPE